jgi:3-oxoacyl-[acyl-carrier protein] reductase
MKTAVITGCNRGLGKAFMEAYATNGYDIIAIVRTINVDFEDCIRKLQGKCGITIFPICTELSDKESLQSAMNNILTMGRPIDVLINNAAYNVSTPIFFMDYGDVEKSLKVNYLAPFFLMKGVCGLMARQGYGNIINISSVAGLSPEPAGSAYDASKAALNSLTKSVAQEVAAMGIRVNAIACSVVATDMFNNMKPDVQKKILKRVAMKRPAEFKEITETALFLSSDKASYITGQIFCVDGGYKV